MTKRSIAINLNLDEQNLQAIQEVVPGWDIYIGKDIAEEKLNKAEILVHWRESQADKYVKSNNLKWVQSWSAGVDYIDLDHLKKNDIYLTSANGVHAFPISETIFAYMLGFTRLIHTYIKQQQEKKWHHANLNGEIHGKTISIIGVGKIGKETAKIAQAFNMKVLGVRHSGKNVDYVDEMYTPDDLKHVLEQSDFVVVTLPLTNETRHMFGKEQFNQMKDSAFFVNIGRGPIVDEKALITALQQKEIAGAGLDVFESEPLQSDSPLWEMDNVIITPHSAGATEYYTNRVIQDIFIPNLKTYLDKGAPSINVFQHNLGY
ncbi:D-2-hydroxyacid dehydrogenase [Oceanobacillus sp. 1P07AA]|uniref:D-2-hydroxyacid dehydrogenase n=1 Tax=Oceanobacillus sp. 1P07AA TaxID=3132293 RepID=UPI0039A518F9